MFLAYCKEKNVMDNLILKIICVAIVLVLFVRFVLSVNDDRIKDICKRSDVNSTSVKSDKIYNSSDGARADEQSCIDNSVHSDSYVDSNHK